MNTQSSRRPKQLERPSKSLVLRTDSGELVGRRSLPPQGLRWTTYGHKVLAFRDRGDKSDLFLSDPVKGDESWSHTVSGNVNTSGVKGTIVDNEAVRALRAQWPLCDAQSCRWESASR